jgi:hypothetical protein
MFFYEVDAELLVSYELNSSQNGKKNKPEKPSRAKPQSTQRESTALEF